MSAYQILCFVLLAVFVLSVDSFDIYDQFSKKVTEKPSVPIVTSETLSLSQRASVIIDFKASSRLRLNSSSISENGTSFWTSAYSRIKLSIFSSMINPPLKIPYRTYYNNQSDLSTLNCISVKKIIKNALRPEHFPLFDWEI